MLRDDEQISDWSDAVKSILLSKLTAIDYDGIRMIVHCSYVESHNDIITCCDDEMGKFSWG